MLTNFTVQEAIPYCQCSGGPPSECCGNCPYCSSTRCDCSGFVSNCWGQSTGYTTETLPQISHQISKDELLPGDIMLNTGDHVVFFGGWCDSSNTTYHCYQEPGCHVTGQPHHAFESCVTYPFNWDPSAFIPYRYNKIVNSPVPSTAPTTAPSNNPSTGGSANPSTGGSSPQPSTGGSTGGSSPQPSTKPSTSGASGSSPQPSTKPSTSGTSGSSPKPSNKPSSGPSVSPKTSESQHVLEIW